MAPGVHGHGSIPPLRERRYENWIKNDLSVAVGRGMA